MTLQLELGRQGMRASTLICIQCLEAAVKIMFLASTSYIKFSVFEVSCARHLAVR